MDAAAQGVSTPPTSPPDLDDDFDVDRHLRHADAESNVVRIVAQVLGRHRGALFVDTAEGVYSFPPEAVRRLQLLDGPSLYVVDLDPAATCALHSTIGRLVRTRTGTLPSGSADAPATTPYRGDDGSHGR